jgi:hypothetical protein
VKIKARGLKETFEWLKNLDENIEKQLIELATHDAYERAKKLSSKHTKTGNMETNIKSKVSYKNKEGIVYIDDIGMLVNWKGKRVNYAAFVLFGTRPHVIEAKNRRALRFSLKGVDEFVYRKKVNHPGYRGDDFLFKAAQETLKRIDKIYEKVKV